MSIDVLHDLGRTPTKTLDDSSVDLAVDYSLIDEVSAVMAGPDSLRGDFRSTRVNLNLDGADTPAVAEVCIALECTP